MPPGTHSTASVTRAPGLEYTPHLIGGLLPSELRRVWASLRPPQRHTHQDLACQTCTPCDRATPNQRDKSPPARGGATAGVSHCGLSDLLERPQRSRTELNKPSTTARVHVCLVVSDSCDPVDCSPPGSSPWDFPARTLEGVAIPSSRGSS